MLDEAMAIARRVAADVGASHWCCGECSDGFGCRLRRSFGRGEGCRRRARVFCRTPRSTTRAALFFHLHASKTPACLTPRNGS